MATTSLRFFSTCIPTPTPPHFLPHKKPHYITCSSATSPEDLPVVPSSTTTDVEKRRPSTIFRDLRQPPVPLPEPPNFQIGWKRTKEIKTEKPKGWVIADFMEKLEALMGRQYGSRELLAKVAYIAAERAREEAEILKVGGKVEDRMVTELNRVLRLLEMDMEMVKAAVKEDTIAERIEQAKARCRQVVLVALSF